MEKEKLLNDAVPKCHKFLHASGKIVAAEDSQAAEDKFS
jgi:hypothetical protein